MVNLFGFGGVRLWVGGVVVQFVLFLEERVVCDVEGAVGYLEAGKLHPNLAHVDDFLPTICVPGLKSGSVQLSLSELMQDRYQMVMRSQIVHIQL